MLHRLADFILGVHPNNTFFSFNWHNVRHINNFYHRMSGALCGRRDLAIADIGGGKSPYFPYFAQMSNKYFVVDLQSALPANETRPILQFAGTAENIPLEDNSIDVVLCNQVLEHVDIPTKSLSEIYRIMKRGGHFYGSAPHVSPIHLEPHDYLRFTSFGIEKLLKNAGFENIVIEDSGGVFTTAALMISMDLLLCKIEPSQPQKFNKKLSILLFPIIGFLNIAGLFADFLFGNKGRTPANICWHATK